MKTLDHSFHEIQEEQIDLSQIEPHFRKATLNMIAAHHVCQKSVQAFKKSHPQLDLSQLATLVATHFGEVSSSLEFLTTWHDSQLAKPILFQNSLHNSTLGFVSIQLGLTGPAMTISADIKMDESVFYTAHALLQTTPFVLICYVDMVPTYLKENYIRAFPYLKPHLGWARSVILTAENLENTSSPFLFSSLISPSDTRQTQDC